jgi:hypothetical protein
VAQVVEHLLSKPSRHEALLSPPPKKKKTQKDWLVWILCCSSRTCEVIQFLCAWVSSSVKWADSSTCLTISVKLLMQCLAHSEHTLHVTSPCLLSSSSSGAGVTKMSKTQPPFHFTAWEEFTAARDVAFLWAMPSWCWVFTNREIDCYYFRCHFKMPGSVIPEEYGLANITKLSF